ncbi:MAG: GPW/gp25 family protein [Dehalococcoidia bacterium]|nr:GPW/gp25 family protein [Dehalococcoidia bacterium]
MEDNKNFLGTGWAAFPTGVDRARGGIAMVRGVTDIEESIRIIIRTAKGERRMRPEFGCSIHDLVFAPNNAMTASLAAHYVQQALGQWEPRIEVLEVKAEVDPDESACLLVRIQYQVQGVNDERNLVFPFYRIPGEE